MPDFKQIVKEQMCQCKGAWRDEVIEELAGHLEECYEALVLQGIAPPAALQAALSQVNDWKRLRREIAAARSTVMTDNVRCILIPAMASLLIASAGEKMLWHFGIGTPYVYQYWSWLSASMPMLAVWLLAGAAGAAGSLYAGGSVRQRIWAAEFHVFCMLVMFVTILAGNCFAELFLKNAHAMGWHYIQGAVLRYLLLSILLPAVMLLLGALPFLAIRQKTRGRAAQAR